MLKGEERRRQGDRIGSRQALEQATKLEPRLTGAHRLLAATYEELGEHALAIEHYRLVLDEAPDDLLALNNLAYALAVHAGKPADALEPARKAHALSRGRVPSITDTLGWVHYLLGEHAEAEKYLMEAAAAAPNSADVQLHLAHVYLARGQRELASRTLARSLQLDAKLGQRDDVKALRAKLGMP
jgi:Tfp pilus assembly protein PilF